MSPVGNIVSVSTPEAQNGYETVSVLPAPLRSSAIRARLLRAPVLALRVR
jgi:hypothetical protein